MRVKLIFTIVLSVIFSMLGLAEAKTFKIAYLAITHAYPLFVEKDLCEAGLNGTKIELVKFGSWVELAEALNTGKVDGASILVQLAIKAKEKGIGLKALALGHRDGNVFVTSPDIDSATQLKGKTIAIPSKLSTHNILLYQTLKSANMTFGDINVVELPPPEMPAALSEKRIDGYIVAEPFGAKAVAANKGKVLLKSEDIWANSICCALVLSDAVINENRTEVQEFMNGYVQAAALIERRDTRAKDIGKKYLKVDANVLNLSLEWISYKDLKIAEKDYVKLTTYLTEMGLSQTTPMYMDFVDNSFIDNVK